jgi:hypothetical protein
MGTPYDDLAPVDPQELVGVDPSCGTEVTRHIAAAFAGEFAQLGYSGSEILGLFRTPFYATVHRTWQLLGEEEIARIVTERVTAWRRVTQTTIELPDGAEAKPPRPG